MEESAFKGKRERERERERDKNGRRRISIDKKEVFKSSVSERLKMSERMAESVMIDLGRERGKVEYSRVRNRKKTK